MRRAYSPLFLSSLVFAFGCGSDDACVIDSDCVDFTMVCVERQCVPAGSVDSGGPQLPDAGEPGDDDAGGIPDAGPTMDAGMDAATGDAGPMDGGAFDCSELVGEWNAANETGCAEGPVTISHAPDGAARCSFTAEQTFVGDFSVDADDAVTGTFTVGAEEISCEGSAAPDTITLTCGDCAYELTKVSGD